MMMLALLAADCSLFESAGAFDSEIDRRNRLNTDAEKARAEKRAQLEASEAMREAQNKRDRRAARRAESDRKARENNYR